MTDIEVNTIKGMFVGEYGEDITITLVDEDGAAVNVSAYTEAISVKLRSPDELKLVTVNAAFSTDGTNGVIVMVPISGDIDRPGKWTGQIQLGDTDGDTLHTLPEVIKSYVFTMDVGEGVV